MYCTILFSICKLGNAVHRKICLEKSVFFLGGWKVVQKREGWYLCILLKQVFPYSSAERGCLGQAAVSYKLTSGARDSKYVWMEVISLIFFQLVTREVGGFRWYKWEIDQWSGSTLQSCLDALISGSCHSTGKESACHAGDLVSIPALWRSPWEGKGHPLRYSGLENFTDYIVDGVTKSWTQLSNFHFQDRYFPLVTNGFPGGSTLKNLPAMQGTWVQSPGWEDPLEKGKATHSSILA